MIRFDQVTKRFGAKAAVSDLSLEVAPGEIVGLLGPNGSGKTTTIRLMLGAIRPDAGAIWVNGSDPAQAGEAVRSTSGVLTETAGFYAHLSGLDNLRFFSRLYGVTDDRRAHELLETFGLTEHQHKKVGVYSTGMKKRLGLAKALLHRPSILFLDEPTNGLDPEGIRMVLQYIAELGRQTGTTMVLCSHLLAQLELVCHRYVFIDEGRLIEQGTRQELEAKYRGDIMLHVETDLKPPGDRFHSWPVKRLGPAELQFTLPDKEAVPQLLRSILAEAAVYGAKIINQDLESLYFRIREVVLR